MSSIIKETVMENGSILVELEGYGGDADFFRIFDLVNSVLEPETSRTSIDSLCAMGTFRKDGIPVRMSSEGLTENVSFIYDASELDRAQLAKVRSWFKLLEIALRER